MSDDGLEVRPLGHTGLSTSSLAVGTWGLCAQTYGNVFGDQATRTLERAVAVGITTFDLAPTWGDGAAETLAAQAVGDKRDEVLYVTRAGRVCGEHGLHEAFEPDALREQCEQSLQRLKTDRIDVWLLHGPDEACLERQPVRDCAEALVKEGKVRAWGASVSDLATAKAAIDAGAQVLCVPFSLAQPQLLWDLRPLVTQYNVGVMARSTLQHGLLSGRWTAGRRFGPQDHRTQRWSPEALAARVQHVNALRYLVRGNVLSMTAAALRFALAEQVVGCAVLGPRTPGHVEAALHAVRNPPYLPDEDLERLRRELPLS